MPFDERDFPARVDDPAARNDRIVAVWLFGVCAMLLVMIVLGGATRLTGSGLSIMEWAPVSGILPPWSDAEWRRLYALYQQIPQYKLLNDGFGLDGFKHIFWLEWTAPAVGQAARPRVCRAAHYPRGHRQNPPPAGAAARAAVRARRAAGRSRLVHGRVRLLSRQHRRRPIAAGRSPRFGAGAVRRRAVDRAFALVAAPGRRRRDPAPARRRHRRHAGADHRRRRLCRRAACRARLQQFSADGRQDCCRRITFFFRRSSAT